MKIAPSLPTAPVAAVAPSEPRTADRAERTAGAAAQVSLSGDARFVASVAEEMRRAPEIRADVVEATRAAIADGSFERSVDFDRLVERLLADL